MIKRFTTEAELTAAGLPTNESRVALVSETNRTAIDGVNVLRDVPGDGDAVFEDTAGEVYKVAYDTINKALLPSDWTLRGYAFGVSGQKFKVLESGGVNNTWLACWQYTITAIASTSISIGLRMSNAYGSWTDVPITLTSAAINATSAAEISAAIAAKAAEVETTKLTYHAFLANEENLPDENGDRIVVQVDSCNSYQQYDVRGTGCTIALSVWGDMPASTAFWRKTGLSTYWGFMNVARGVAYYTTNGITPTANIPLTNRDIVKLSEFNTSEFCAALRARYSSYREYIADNALMWPHPTYGVFALPSAREMTERWGNKTFVKKDGAVAYKFPALHYGLTVGGGTGKFAVGKWSLPGVAEGVEFMRDEALAKIAEAQRRMGTTILNDSTDRWFAQRYYANSAWSFSGHYGSLNGSNVTSSGRCQATLEIDLK